MFVFGYLLAKPGGRSKPVTLFGRFEFDLNDDKSGKWALIDIEFKLNAVFFHRVSFLF